MKEFRVADENGEGLDDMSLSVEGITNHHATRTEYFKLSGERLTAPTQGICLMRHICDDGSVKTEKVVLK